LRQIGVKFFEKLSQIQIDCMEIKSSCELAREDEMLLISSLHGSRGRGYSIKFYTGRLHPEVQTLTFKYTNFCQNGTGPFIYQEQNRTPFKYLEQNCTPLISYSSRISQNSRISYTIATIFPGFQSFWISCSKGASFYVFRVVISTKIRHPFIYFALATISFTLRQIL